MLNNDDTITFPTVLHFFTYAIESKVILINSGFITLNSSLHIAMSLSNDPGHLYHSPVYCGLVMFKNENVVDPEVTSLYLIKFVF